MARSSTAGTEVRAATRFVWSGGRRGLADPAALAWLPLAGATAGVVAGVVALGVGRWSSIVGGALGLGLLRALHPSRPTPRRLGLLALEALALLPAPVATQAMALVLAPTLGAWSRVVQCHGGRPAPVGEANGLAGRASFREFGVASVLAIGGALAVFDALGLIAVLGAVIPTLLLRALLHRRYGGMPPWGPATSGRLAEAVVILVLATLSWR